MSYTGPLPKPKPPTQAELQAAEYRRQVIAAKPKPPGSPKGPSVIDLRPEYEPAYKAKPPAGCRRGAYQVCVDVPIANPGLTNNAVDIQYLQAVLPTSVEDTDERTVVMERNAEGQLFKIDLVDKDKIEITGTFLGAL